MKKPQTRHDEMLAFIRTSGTRATSIGGDFELEKFQRFRPLRLLTTSNPREIGRDDLGVPRRPIVHGVPEPCGADVESWFSRKWHAHLDQLACLGASQLIVGG
jgi:hypothetical protein